MITTMTSELAEFVQELKSWEVAWKPHSESKILEYDELGYVMLLTDDFFFEVFEMKHYIWRHNWTCLSTYYDETYRLWWEYEDNFFSRRLMPGQLAKFCHPAGLPLPEMGKVK